MTTVPVFPLLAAALLGACGLAPRTAAPADAAAAKALPAEPAAGFTKGELTVLTDPANVCFIEPTEELKRRLSPEQFAVLVENATEPPFRNAYWNNHEPGIYVDAIDGTPLFASREKFDSGSGWPSFWAPLDPDRLVLQEDLSFGMRRIEVRAKKSGGHLGHLFEDGPRPTGLRYCINSASLRFVPAGQLAREGYPELAALFTAALK